MREAWQMGSGRTSQSGSRWNAAGRMSRFTVKPQVHAVNCSSPWAC
jgi:hypothetical protein